MLPTNSTMNKNFRSRSDWKMTKLLISLGANPGASAFWSLEHQKLCLGQIQYFNDSGYQRRIGGTAVQFATVLQGINNGPQPMMTEINKGRFSNDEMNYLVEFLREEVSLSSNMRTLPN